MLAVELERARAHPADVVVRRAEAADVDRPEVERRLAGRDPLGERLAGAAAGRDAERVEAGADVEAAQLRRLAEDEVAIGREALGPLISCLTPAVASAGTRASAGAMNCSKWSQSGSSSVKWKPSGMPSSAQGIGFGS